MYSSLYIYMHGEWYQNPLVQKKMTNTSCIVNIMAAENQATQGAKASTAMVLT